MSSKYKVCFFFLECSFKQINNKNLFYHTVQINNGVANQVYSVDVKKNILTGKCFTIITYLGYLPFNVCF